MAKQINYTDISRLLLGVQNRIADMRRDGDVMFGVELMRQYIKEEFEDLPEASRDDDGETATWKKMPGVTKYQCTNCGKISATETPYCPNCGRHMKEYGCLWFVEPEVFSQANGEENDGA